MLAVMAAAAIAIAVHERHLQPPITAILSVGNLRQKKPYVTFTCGGCGKQNNATSQSARKGKLCRGCYQAGYNQRREKPGRRPMPLSSSSSLSSSSYSPNATIITLTWVQTPRTPMSARLPPLVLESSRTFDEDDRFAVNKHCAEIMEGAAGTSSSSSSSSSSNVGPWKCVVCKRRIAFLRNIKPHLERVHTKRFECGNCKKRFFRRESLQEHIHVHTGESKHACRVCSQRFRWRMAR
mmetsp:Transcript_27575/g.44879  ORF Transcript_27575/g.44879 Transcript_27575/m.44879 type:complete len:238 (-) Transcript_27575:213-926(-)